MGTSGQSILFPQQLANLGFVTERIDGIDLILPPTCYIPAGPFLMGSDSRHDKEAFDGEKPRHWVTLPAFHIAKYPVTVAEYAAFVRNGGSEPMTKDYVTWAKQLQHLDHPVACVQWRDAVKYAAWLVKLTGTPWRLPTEAEWEKAARWDATGKSYSNVPSPLGGLLMKALHWNEKGKGHARIYPWGDRFDKNLCNTNASSIHTTTEVGRYPRGASPYDVMDMAGNVWEWTTSAFVPYPYDHHDGREDPTSSKNRVLRGGAWKLEPRVARSAHRNNEHPENFAGYFYDVGFRLMREISG